LGSCAAALFSFFLLLKSLVGEQALLVFVSLMTTILSVAITRALLVGSGPTPASMAARRSRIDEEVRSRVLGNQDAIAERLAKALCFKTVSHQLTSLPKSKADDLMQQKATALEGLHNYFAESFPVLHKHFPPVKVNRHSLVFEFKGSDAKLKPWLMYAHMDVVPCPENTLSEWRCDPFSGQILEDEMAGKKKRCVFGRGAIDDKGRVLAMLEAMEDLVANSSFKPTRTLFMCFGHDEELSGKEGAHSFDSATYDALDPTKHRKLYS
jgi:acetylornithine deacetylase/succinyl-diaminopimelate desuccinylase-like protein